MTRLLDQIAGPADVQRLAPEQLPQLAAEIRAELLETVPKTGGHLASNLGTVELTIALHRVFHSPVDKLVWDVGHQAYPHKLLTGRARRFHTLRQQHGLAGHGHSQASQGKPAAMQSSTPNGHICQAYQKPVVRPRVGSGEAKTEWVAEAVR